MTLKMIESKAKKLGLQIHSDGRQFWIDVNGKTASWYRNGTEGDYASAIHCHRNNDVSDFQTDYFSGFFAHTIKIAFNYLLEKPLTQPLGVA